jgi:hypothetical protein
LLCASRRSSCGPCPSPTRPRSSGASARSSAPNIAGLITVRVGSRAGKPTLSCERDQAAIAHAAATDGICALATNKPGRLSAAHVLELYKGQEIVERRHRDFKQMLKVRPIFLHHDDPTALAVAAHVEFTRWIAAARISRQLDQLRAADVPLAHIQRMEWDL